MHWYLVAIRATWTIDVAGNVSLAERQDSPQLEPEYFGEPGLSSLRVDSDLLERKPGTDVIVVGAAVAPELRPVQSLELGLRVADVHKALIVHGEREYCDGVDGLTTTTPLPFVELPLRYDYAFGGSDATHEDPTQHQIDLRNPIGRGHPLDVNRLAGHPAHRIERVGQDTWHGGPAGFGAIDRSWTPRRAHAGTYDEAWAQSKRPLLPNDYDRRFAMSAPGDQQFATPLLGGEPVEVSRMTPDAPIKIRLPRLGLGCRTQIRRESHSHAAQLSTVLIEPGERRLSMTWQSSIRVGAPDVDWLSTTEITYEGQVS